MKKAEKKNKKVLFFIICLLVILAVVIFFIVKNYNKDNDNNNNNDISSGQVQEDGFVNMITVKSTDNNRIEKDGVEATSIKVDLLATDLKVETTLRNNTSEDLQGYFVEIALLDEHGNTITSIAENSEEIVKANSEVKLVNYVSGFENKSEVKGAKIVNLEKRNSKIAIEETFEEMEDEAVE